MNRACEEALNEPPSEPEPHREGIDWIRTADGDVRHSLQHRCFESAIKFRQRADELGLERCDDRDLDQFLSEFQITGQTRPRLERPGPGTRFIATMPSPSPA